MILFSIVLNVSVAHGAKFELELDRESGCSFWIKGKISQGDAVRFAEYVTENQSSAFRHSNSFDLETFTVCLSSEGGNLVEGLAFANLFAFGLGKRPIDWPFETVGPFSTFIPDGHNCISACALAFLGGRAPTYFSSPSVPFRRLGLNAGLGFHAPKLDIFENDMKGEEPRLLNDETKGRLSCIPFARPATYGTHMSRKNREKDTAEGNTVTNSASLREVELAYEAAILEISQLIARVDVLEIPVWILSEIVATPPDRIWCVDTVEKATELNILLLPQLNVGELSLLNHYSVCRAHFMIHGTNEAIIEGWTLNPNQWKGTRGWDATKFESERPSFIEQSISDVVYAVWGGYASISNRSVFDLQPLEIELKDNGATQFIMDNYGGTLTCEAEPCDLSVDDDQETCYSLKGDGTYSVSLDRVGTPQLGALPSGVSLERLSELSSDQGEVIKENSVIEILDAGLSARCAVFYSNGRFEREPCRIEFQTALLASLDRRHQAVFVWPSGSRTVLEAVESCSVVRDDLGEYGECTESLLLNGSEPAELSDLRTDNFRESLTDWHRRSCIRNGATGNVFCYEINGIIEG